jgi:hypothetical protein
MLKKFSGQKKRNIKENLRCVCVYVVASVRTCTWEKNKK